VSSWLILDGQVAKIFKGRTCKQLGPWCHYRLKGSRLGLGPQHIVLGSGPLDRPKRFQDYHTIFMVRKINDTILIYFRPSDPILKYSSNPTQLVFDLMSSFIITPF